MEYKVIKASTTEELEKLVVDKIQRGYTLQGGVSLLPICYVIGENKINSSTNFAATTIIEVMYAQAVIKGLNSN